MIPGISNRTAAYVFGGVGSLIIAYKNWKVIRDFAASFFPSTSFTSKDLEQTRKVSNGIRDLSSERKTNESHDRETTENIEELNDQVDDLVKGDVELNRTIEELRKKARDRRETIKNLKKELATSQADNRSLRSENMALKNKLNTIQNENKSLRAREPNLMDVLHPFNKNPRDPSEQRELESRQKKREKKS